MSENAVNAVRDLRLQFVGSISDSATAIQRSGKLEGGGKVSFDVPEVYISRLAALMPLVGIPLVVTVEVGDLDPEAQAKLLMARAQMEG